MNLRMRLEESWGQLDMKFDTLRFDEVSINFDKKRKPLSSMERVERKGRYRYYGAQGIIDYIDDYIFDGDYLLIAEDGENLKSKKQNIAQLVHGQFWVNNHAHIIQTNELCGLRYLYYLINSMDLSGYITGSAQPKLSQANLNALELNIPERSVQGKIVSVIGDLDDRITMNSRINDNLYEQVTNYYKHLFAGITSTTSVGEMADNIFSGGTPSTANEAYWNGDHYWLSSGETSNRFIVSTIKTITDEGITNSSTRKANKYDIAIASAGQGHTRGQTSMLLTETYVNQSIIVVHADGDYLPFLFWNIANRYEELRVISNSNSIRGSLTTKMISSLNIPKTEAARIKQFSDYAWPIIKTIENNLNENQRLTAIRNVLLPKLMSGELDVSNLDI